MLEDAVACGVLVAVAAAVVRGGYNVAVGGFLSMAIGALAVAAALSFVVSAVATLSLQSFASSPMFEGRFMFVRAALAAVAQPTVSGIALLGTILVLGRGCSLLHHAFEDITILLACHSEMSGSKRHPEKKNQ